MMNSDIISTEEPDLPLEMRLIWVEKDGNREMVPGLDKTWVDMMNRKFSRYVTHPYPVNGEFRLGEKETWLEITRYVIEDLEWLLQQKHHIFWSHMIHSKDAHQLIITFLQEAPPYYLRDEFPKDDEMEELLSKVEYFVFLILVRLSTKKESDKRFIDNLGILLYDNYIFTVPMFLDICLVYGIGNRSSVLKMFNDVLSAAPQYLDDFKEIVPHFMYVLSVVKNEFETNEMCLVNDKTKSKDMTDLILYLYDSCANIHIFFDIHSASCNLLRLESFLSEVSTFYSYVIPKIYKYFKRSFSRVPNGMSYEKKIDEIRLNLILIVRNAFCNIINDVLNEEENKGDYANEYLTKMMEIIQGPIFLTDYNEIYPIDADLKILSDICSDIDSENFNYISQAITSMNEKPGIEKPPSGIHLDSLVAQIKDILPHLGDGFVKQCLEFYNYDSERVLASIFENRLPPDIKEKMDVDTRNIEHVPMNQETLDLLNDKTEINLIRDKITAFALTDDYDDEYDSTYDDRDIVTKEARDEDEWGRPFVTPMVLRKREYDQEGSDEEEEEDEDEEEEEDVAGGETTKPRDCFVANPAEIRAKQEQRRNERRRRDYVGKGKGNGQEKQVFINRDYKDAHKSYIANHNRRKLSSRKRNNPLINS